MCVRGGGGGGGGQERNGGRDNVLWYTYVHIAFSAVWASRSQPEFCTVYVSYMQQS